MRSWVRSWRKRAAAAKRAVSKEEGAKEKKRMTYRRSWSYAGYHNQVTVRFRVQSVFATADTARVGNGSALRVERSSSRSTMVGFIAMVTGAKALWSNHDLRMGGTHGCEREM